jgi:hypothetical protein
VQIRGQAKTKMGRNGKAPTKTQTQQTTHVFLIFDTSTLEGTRNERLQLFQHRSRRTKSSAFSSLFSSHAPEIVSTLRVLSKSTVILSFGMPAKSAVTSNWLSFSTMSHRGPASCDWRRLKPCEKLRACAWLFVRRWRAHTAKKKKKRSASGKQHTQHKQPQTGGNAQVGPAEEIVDDGLLERPAARGENAGVGDGSAGEHRFCGGLSARNKKWVRQKRRRDAHAQTLVCIDNVQFRVDVG